MFHEAAGPTALRENLVYGLSFSQRDVAIEPGGPLARAGIAAVWNGTRGLVVVMICTLDPSAIRRFEWDQPVASRAELERVLDQADHFAGTFGFHMDPSEFESLGAREKERRLRAWNSIRKVRSPQAPPVPTSPASKAVPEAVGRPVNLEEEDPANERTVSYPMGIPEAVDPSQVPESRVPEKAVETSERAILGRMQIKQYRRPDARVRVLSHF